METGTESRDSDGPVISTGRAQDWISSVLNPIVDGLAQEEQHLARHRWEWIPSAGAFEYLYPVPEYVHSDYLDNLEDFLEKHADFRGRFAEHDALLAQLGDQVSAAYDQLTGSPAGEAFREVARRAIVASGCDDAPEELVPLFAAYIVSGMRQVPQRYEGSSVFNTAVAAREEAQRIVARELASSRQLAEKLADVNLALLRDLRRTRTHIADRYGARIRPTPPTE